MKNLFFVLGALVVLASCKKDSSENPATPGSTKKLVKATYVWDNGTPEIDEYTYDAQGRISTKKDETRTYTFNYVSASSLIVPVTKNSDNSLEQTLECTINDKGYVTKIAFRNLTGNVFYMYTYAYNADGYIIRVEAIPATGTGYEVDYTVVNGNVVSSIYYNGGVLNRSGHYTYDNSKINKAPGSIGGFWQVNGLFGKGPKNLISEYKTINPAGTLTWHSQLTYTVDANGYAVQVINKNVLQGKQGVDSYIYQ
jgi:Domain of unknown function (DUF4595) with porin-like fold